MESIKNDLFEFSVDENGIGVMIINQINNPTNLFSSHFIDAYIKFAHLAISDNSIKGVIITSGQDMFMPGADLRELKNMQTNAKQQLDSALKMHRNFRLIETSGKPFVAAINGTAMGGGFELCLTCHYRIALNNPRLKIGFPEIKVGLLPGGGGVAKIPYLTGIQKGLIYLLQGKGTSPQQAFIDGLIDEVVETPEALMSIAKQWILSNPNPVQPWDNKKHRIPGGGLLTTNGAQIMAGAIGNVRKKTHGNYPAAQFILSIIYEGLNLPIDRALEIEARYFTKVLGTKEAKNMIRTGFLGMQAARKGKIRPINEPKYNIKKVGVLGAGIMGAGIAFVSAKSGLEVVLKDISMESAEKGKEYSEKILNKAIANGGTTIEKAKIVLDRITPTDDFNGFNGVDLIIEAVFENPALKAKVTQETEAVLGRDKIYGSNTSTIPITQLARASKRPKNFIGIHFFSPVEKMPLVEIIVGEKTSQKAIAAAIDYTTFIRKVPIVVNDSRFFFTSRCFGTYVSEGMFLLEEGVPAALIENVAKMEGMPIGPLAVHDEVSLTLSIHIYENDSVLNKLPHQIRAYNITKILVNDYNRKGKKEGRGFYDYPKGEKKILWTQLATIFKTNLNTMDKNEVAKRLMYRQALEAFKCLDEGVLNRAIDGDIGSVLGWGFPIYTGGAISFIDYIGVKKFIVDCDLFVKKYGIRWQVPDSLRKVAKNNDSVLKRV